MGGEGCEVEGIDLAADVRVAGVVAGDDDGISIRSNSVKR